jgi:hypothetical protein
VVSTDVQIVNLALHHLGVERISSLDEDSKRAKLMKDLYELTLNEVLRSATWGFAMKRAKLDKLSTAPAFEYSAQFNLPVDYLKLHEVTEFDPSRGTGQKHPYVNWDEPYRLQYKIEGTRILASADTLYVRYIAKVTDVGTFSPDFIECLSRTLASKACFSLTQDRNLRSALMEEAEFWRRTASANDAQESSPDEHDISAFIRPRY